MAPRKDKPEKLSNDKGSLIALQSNSIVRGTNRESTAADTILKYLRKQNRPYSATDISANLHNAVSKAKTQTLLKEMQERGEINVSSAGKQSVYHALQEAGDLSNEEDLVGMDGSVANMRDAIHNLKEKHKSLVSTLAHLESTPTTVQLYHSASEKQIQMEGMISRLKTLTDSNVAPVSVQERRMVEESLRIASERLLRRKVIQQELFGAILEATLDCGSADELAERIGLQFFV